MIISKTSSVRYPENLNMSRYILQDFMMEKKKKIVDRNRQKSRNLVLKNWVDRFFLNFPEMFLDTNVTDLLKKKLGSPNSFLKKTRKTAIFSAI